MFKELVDINSRPKPFQFYTAEQLWTDGHTAKQMLKYHLSEDLDLSSRNRKFIDTSVQWIVDYFGVEKTTRIADFGCGPGLYTTRFAEQGANVTGIDFSRNSLNYAEKTAKGKYLSIEYIHTNYLSFTSSKTFDLITMIMCDFCALSPEQREVLLRNFHTFLPTGGRVLLDVYSLNSFHTKRETAEYQFNQLEGFWSPDDYYCFVNSFKYDTEKVSVDKYTVIEESRKRIIYNWLQYFSRETLQRELEECGFQVDEFFSDVAGTTYAAESDTIAVVARKL